MVLQRWQTVLLLLAFVFEVVFLSTPIGHTTCGDVYAIAYPGLFVLGTVTAVLLFIDMFLYSNLRLQIKWAAAIIVLEVVGVVLAFVVSHLGDGFGMTLWSEPAVLAALLLTWFGRRLMIRDRKLLASADRLR